MATYKQPLEPQELESLVIAAQAGNREAFGELFERFERHVQLIAMEYLRDHGDAQELTQDVFVKAMEKLDQLREPRRFAGWLRCITQRMAINRIVRRKPVVCAEPEYIESSCVDARTPLELAMDSERKLQLHAGLDRLGDMDRETLSAFYLRGESLREMSASFEAPVGTIKRRLHTARKRLYQQVEEPIAV